MQPAVQLPPWTRLPSADGVQPAGSSARKFFTPDDVERGRRAFDRSGSFGRKQQLPGAVREKAATGEPYPAGEEPTEATRLCLQASRLLASGETDDAYDLYCDVLAIDSYNVKALSALAVLNHKRGMFETARTLYNRCLRADPTRSKTAYNLGRLEHECKNHAAARDLYRVCREMNPDEETLCSSLAYEGLLLQDEFDDPDAALQCYEESLARDPKHVRTLDHKCALLERSGQHREAKLLHDTVRTLDPGHATSWCPYYSSLFSGELIDGRQMRSYGDFPGTQENAARKESELTTSSAQSAPRPKVRNHDKTSPPKESVSKLLLKRVSSAATHIIASRSSSM